MTRRIPNAPSPFIVDLGGRDVLVVEEILHRLDCRAGIEQKRCCGRP